MFRKAAIKTAVFMMAGFFSLITSFTASSATHQIAFGGALGFAYSPASFSANVGDTITWTGSFALHPLASAVIPAGADAWSHTTGTTFSYVVAEAGLYHYTCSLHGALGMTGSFTVSALSVNNTNRFARVNDFSALAITSKGNTKLVILAPENGTVSITARRLDGRAVKPVVHQKVVSGSKTIIMTSLAAGAYIFDIRYSGQDIFLAGVVTDR